MYSKTEDLKIYSALVHDDSKSSRQNIDQLDLVLDKLFENLLFSELHSKSDLNIHVPPAGQGKVGHVASMWLKKVESYGIKGEILGWIAAFLSNRTQ